MKMMQTRINKRFDSAQKKYKRNYDTNVCSALPFKADQIVYINKPLLLVSFTGSCEMLATTSYNKSMPKVLRPFAILFVQPKMQIIDENCIHIAVSINRAVLALGNKQPTIAAQHLPVEEEPTTDLNANR